jgi:large repetitive protein
LKNWLSNWKARRNNDLEYSLRASRPKPSADLVKAIMGDVRRRPVRPQVRLGRALVGATALALLVIGVSIAGGLGATGGLKQSVSFAPTGGSGGSQYIVAPVVSSVVPGAGIVGDSVAIHGTGFTGTTTVSFHGTNQPTFTVIGDTEIDTTVPAGATTGPITVTNTAGSGASSSFTVYVTPSISSLSISSGSIGAAVTITGSGFTGTTSVKFNGTSAGFTVNSDTSISTTVPVGATDGNVTVTNPAGTSGGAAFTIAPSSIAFSPGSGLPGQVVVISGSHFTGATSVKFNGTSASSMHVDSDTQITAVVGSGSSTGPVSVTTPDGTGTSASSFVVITTPVVSSFTPGSGGAGASVTITGSHFTGASSVKFNTTAATFTLNSDTQITTHVPVGATSGHITVTTSVGSGVSSGTFTVLALPTISSFLPTSGDVGASVTVNGSHFTGATAVTFNGRPAITFSVVTDTKITATVPAGATTGKVGVTTAAGTALSAGSFTVFQGPVVSSFTPTSSTDGGTVTVFGSGFTGATAVKLGTTTATFTLVSDTQLTLKVPATLATGNYTIHVTNPQGTGDSGTQLSVGPIVAPTITQPLSPEQGPANALFQQSVVITGTGFNSVTGVSFGTKAATSVTINSNTQITVLAPVGAATGKVSVTNPKGTATSTDTFTVVAPPTVISFSPSSGAVGSSVTITGANLVGTGALTVSFNGTPATSVPVHTATQIQAVVPAGATSGPITVTNGGIGAGSSATSFIVVGTPTVTSLSPVSGKAGTTVTVTGSGFLGGTPSVAFGTVNALASSVHVSSNTVLTVTAPTPIAVPSSVPVVVTNGAGSSNNTVSFKYQAAPVITNFTPNHGPANATMTTRVDFTGSNFTGVTTVSFGSKPGTFVVNSDTSLTAWAPIGASTGTLTVTNPTGTTTAGTFTVDAAPVITGFANPTPPAGALPGATGVQIKGMNFRNGDTVSFNGVAATSTFVSATQINATVPLTATTGFVTVSDALTGTATSPVAFIVIQNPAITGFTPGSGVTTPATTVTVFGSGFLGGGITVRFNGVLSGTVSVLSDGVLTAKVPSGATTGFITVTNAANSATSSDVFFVALKPTIASFSPASGPGSAQATTVVDIGGSNFNGTTAVLFNGKASPFITVDDNNDITAIVPAGATSGKITITNPAGSATSALSFTVDAAPSVSSISPSKGAVGDVVTINGNGFIGEMGGTAFPNDTTVDFPNAPGATIDTITNTKITVEVPDFATSGPLVVTNTWGEQGISGIFSVIQPPTVSSFLNESTGLESGKVGAPVLIFGSGFTGATSVKFNGTSASYALIGDFEIIATVPHGATNGTISVTNPAGTDASADSFTVLP